VERSELASAAGQGRVVVLADNAFQDHGFAWRSNDLLMRAVLLDNYRAGKPRPLGFARPDFNFDFPYDGYGKDFAVAQLDNPEQMTAYRLRLVEKFAQDAGLQFHREPIAGVWSGSVPNWISTQGLIILEKL
jgi:hypothetical protein